MAPLSRVSDYLWSFVAPRKTQQRRDKPFRAPSPKSGAGRPTAASKVHQWRQLHKSLSSTTPQARDSSATPDPQTQADRAVTAEFDNGVTVDSIELPHSTSPNSRASHLSHPSDEFDANESTLVLTEHDYANERLEHKETFDIEAERERLQQLQEELRDKGWADDAISLYIRLESRGKEPLLPKAWELEFETLPAALFTPDGFTPYIDSTSEGGNFRASLALKELIKLAPRVRDADFATRKDSKKKHKSPETVTKKAIHEYLKWAYADAKLDVASPNSRKSLDASLATGKSLPLLISEAGPRTMSGAELQAITLDKLVKLGEQWKASLADRDTGEYITELPTLYGIISTFTVFGFVAYDIDFVNDDNEIEPPFLRTIAVFDFSQKGHDVWNSLALAIFGVHVRNEMIDIRKDVQAVKGADFGVARVDDTDA